MLSYNSHYLRLLLLLGELGNGLYPVYLELLYVYFISKFVRGNSNYDVHVKCLLRLFNSSKFAYH